MKIRKVLALVGSARPLGHSTSESLARHFIQALEAQGAWSHKVLHVHRHMYVDQKRQKLLEQVDSADLVVLATPVYMDALPYLVTRALEAIGAHRSALDASAKTPRLMALINCGFPEVEHTEVAMAICHAFALKAKLRWCGGLGMGAGEFIGGRPLEEVGGAIHRVASGLEMAAEAVHRGDSVPEPAKVLLGRPLVPRGLYTAIGNWGMKRRADANGQRGRLDDTPYAPKPESEP